VVSCVVSVSDSIEYVSGVGLGNDRRELSRRYGGFMDERALTALRRRGFVPGEVLGAGMEGTVVELSGGLVAKAWHSRTRKALGGLLEFGLALGAAPIPFAVSGAVELLEHDGAFVTIERRVEGVPLRLAAQQDPPPATEEEAQLMGDVLEGLSLATDLRLGTLPVLPEEPPFDPAEPFSVSLAALVQRRYAATAQLLRSAVPGADALVAVLAAELRALPETVASLVHGDLVPANVLVRGDEVAGVLDFGFLSTLGDPQFDAAVAASIFDMYGVNARRSEAVLDAHFLERFGHEPRAYALYRAAYAVVTHAAYSAEGTDGHFAWCAAMLRRLEVRSAIGV
jgi:aminoglycoside phosphotransferase (APT) family kinase protein